MQGAEEAVGQGKGGRRSLYLGRFWEVKYGYRQTFKRHDCEGGGMSISLANMSKGGVLRPLACARRRLK